MRDVLYAVPNGGSFGGKAGVRVGVRKKAEGLTSGVPDFECFVAVAPYTGYHCEMKRTNGKPSDVKPEQVEMMRRLEAEGRKCEIGYGCADAWKKLCNYLRIDP